MYYKAIIFVLYLVCLRNSNGCKPFTYGVPEPGPRLSMHLNGRDSTRIICTSKGKESNDMLEIMVYSNVYGKYKVLGSTINNSIEIKLSQSNMVVQTVVYCRVRNGYNNVLKKTSSQTLVFEPDEEYYFPTSTVITSTAIATTLSTTPSEEAMNVLPLQNETNIIDQPADSDLGSKLSSPIVIGGLITISILLVMLLTGVIICFNKRRRLRAISKDDTAAKQVVQYVELELEPALYSNSRPFTKETPYAEIIGVVKKK